MFSWMTSGDWNVAMADGHRCDVLARHPGSGLCVGELRLPTPAPWAGAQCADRISAYPAGLLRQPGMQPEKFMSLGTILLIVLVLILIGVVPMWPHSANWGYMPSGGLGLVVLVLLVLLVMGRL